MNYSSTPQNKNNQKPDNSWIEIISKYNRPDLRKSIWQIINSVFPYLILWVLMIYSLHISYWITLGLSVVAAGFLVRIFIIFHDCGHQSFFRSKKLNNMVGIILGMFTFTPYYKWHHSHRLHHETVGNLDSRGYGDVWTLTVTEYLNLPKMKRFYYKLYRNPFLMFGIGSFLSMTVFSRFTTKKMDKKDRRSIRFTNLILFIIVLGMSLLIGLKAFLLIQLPVIFIGAASGVWLFYLQHQYEDVIWCNKGEWDYKKMALEGSSFYKLPRILQWFTGNIGFHHIHHLSPRIPSYNLPKCHRENSLFSKIKPVTFFSGFKSLKLRLWDEKAGRMISFRKLRYWAS